MTNPFNPHLPPQLPDLPLDLWVKIFDFTNEKPATLASISKKHAQAIELAFSRLLQSYESHTILRPYAQEQKIAERDRARVRKIYDKTIKKAQQLGFKEKLGFFQMLSAPHLQDVVLWIKEKEAEN